MKGAHIGELEELSLLLVMILGQDAYVLKIKEELFNKAGRTITMGALHSTLNRLDKKGLLESEMSGATNERGGRRKRIYSLTAAGESAVKQANQVRQNLWSQVPQLTN